MQQEQAVKDVAALKQLQQKGAASASEVASAEQRLESANASMQNLQQRMTQRYGTTDRTKAEAQVADARAAVAAAQSSYAADNVRSPIPGTVYSIPVNAYDFVPAGEDLLDVADLNRIQIRAYFDEPEIGRLAIGQAVKIIWDAKPNQAWHGHISRAPTTVITYGTRNVGECIITVDDARGDLLPNTNVTVTVTTSQRFNVLSIPREALHTEGASDFVYRVVNGMLVRTPVQVGVVNLTRVEITGGLTEKDTVALSATSNRDLTNGLAVKIVE
jgi:HlyD family secretion protein